jgi:Mn2+/Fe2+ NRAMP family transporter
MQLFTRYYESTFELRAHCSNRGKNRPNPRRRSRNPAWSSGRPRAQTIRESAAPGRIRLDTNVGMAFSNLVALAIIVATAATLHAAGITDVASSSQVAEALRPVAGQFAFTLFALGIVGTGLTGSAAYAISEAWKWPVGLGRKPKKAKQFYATLAIATIFPAVRRVEG